MSFTWLSGAVKYDENERTQTWVVADEFKPKKFDEGKKISCQISSEEIDSCIIDEETQEFMDAISDEIIQRELEKTTEEDDNDLL